MIEREIIWRLLTGPQSDTIRQIGLADSDLSLVSRAIGWIRDNYAEPMRIDDLARLSGMSASAISSALPSGNGHEPVAVSEADPAAGSPLAVGRHGPVTSQASVISSATTAPRNSTVSTGACSGPRQAKTPPA